MSSGSDPRSIKWPRTAWPYVLAFAVLVLAGGVLYFSPRGFTRPGTGPLGTYTSPGVSARQYVVDAYTGAASSRPRWCRGGLSAQQYVVDPYTSVKQEAVAYYRSKYKDDDPGLAAEVTNYGCHLGVYITKGGKVIKSFAYYGKGLFFEQNW